MESCKDYKQSLTYKYHLAYLLGEVLIQANKNLSKGGYLTLNKEIKKAKQIYQIHQEYKEKLKALNLTYYFVTKESLKDSLLFLKELEKPIYKMQSFNIDSNQIQSFFSQIPFNTQMPFLLKYKEEILEWLNSKEFKEQYLDTKHPYPPLLNPERLNARRESKDSIVSNSDCFTLDCHENQRFSRNDASQSKDTEFKNMDSKENIESQSNAITKQKNNTESQNMQWEKEQNMDSKDIQPYPNLSYESIPAGLAWDLNLPLPRRYKMIYLFPHGVGVVKVSEVIRYCWHLRRISLFRSSRNMKQNYVYFYNHLLQGYNLLEFSDDKFRDMDYSKLLALVDSKVPILCQTRDPIEILRHLFSRQNRWIPHSLVIAKEFDKNSCFEDVICPIKKSVYNYDLRLLKDSSHPFPGEFHYHIHLKELQKNIFKIAFLDTRELNSNDIIPKLQTIAKNFGFAPIQDYHKNILQTNMFKGSAYLFLPLTFRASNFKITLKIHSTNSQMIDLYQEIMGKTNETIGIYIDKDKVELFRINEIYKESCKYLKNFMERLEERFQQEDTKALTINDIMEYFKQEPEARKHIKCILDKEVATIAQYRPDIVESWKYYQEFERMCEEMD